MLTRTSLLLSTGDAAVLAFNNPQQCNAKAIELAGDELTGAGYTAMLSDKLQRKLYYVEIPHAVMWLMNRDFAAMQQAFNTVGLHVDVEQVRTVLPNVRTFKQWLDEQRVEQTQAPCGVI